jgi:hypothetical protein
MAGELVIQNGEVWGCLNSRARILQSTDLETAVMELLFPSIIIRNIAYTPSAF